MGVRSCRTRLVIATFGSSSGGVHRFRGIPCELGRVMPPDCCTISSITTALIYDWSTRFSAVPVGLPPTQKLERSKPVNERHTLRPSAGDPVPKTVGRRSQRPQVWPHHAHDSRRMERAPLDRSRRPQRASDRLREGSRHTGTARQFELVLTYRDRAGHAATAAALGCSVRTINYMLPAARRRLADTLDRLDLL